jgi:hypothetical protein
MIFSLQATGLHHHRISIHWKPNKAAQNTNDFGQIQNPLDQDSGRNAPQELVRAVCMSFEKRCRAIVKEQGERFELN